MSFFSAIVIPLSLSILTFSDYTSHFSSTSFFSFTSLFPLRHSILQRHSFLLRHSYLHSLHHYFLLRHTFLSIRQYQLRTSCFSAYFCRGCCFQISDSLKLIDFLERRSLSIILLSFRVS